MTAAAAAHGPCWESGVTGECLAIHQTGIELFTRWHPISKSKLMLTVANNQATPQLSCLFPQTPCLSRHPGACCIAEDHFEPLIFRPLSPDDAGTPSGALLCLAHVVMEIKPGLPTHHGSKLPTELQHQHHCFLMGNPKANTIVIT